MHILGILFFLIQIGFAVHAIRRNEWNWAFLIVFIPLLGCILYLILVILPETRDSTAVRRARRSIKNTVNPKHELRARIANLDAADTVENRVELAEELLKHGMVDDAIHLYEKSLTGIHQTDPDLMLGLAHAYFGREYYLKAKELLDDLIKANPDFKSQQGHLLYARSLEKLNDYDAAREEYEVLVNYYSGPEASCRYGLFLKKQGEHDKARQCFQQILDNARRSSKHFNKLHGKWIDIARQEA